MALHFVYATTFLSNIVLLLMAADCHSAEGIGFAALMLAVATVAYAMGIAA